MPDATTFAYLAGVIDSDGYITAAISRRKGRYYVGAAVGIAGTRREPHDLAASRFGGIVGRYVPRADRAHHRPQFQWQRYGDRAVSVIESVRPFLRVKAEQADLALWLQELVQEAREMRESDDSYPWMPADYSPERDLLAAAEEVRLLNARGYRAAGRVMDGRTWDEYPTAPEVVAA